MTDEFRIEKERFIQANFGNPDALFTPSEDDISRVVSEISKTGLHVHPREIERVAGLVERIQAGEKRYCPGNRVRLIVAKERCDINATLHASPRYNASHQQQTLYGELMGYPLTALQAWYILKTEPHKEEGLFLSFEEIPQDEYSFLVQFRLTRKSWREELETVKEWGEALKEAAPRLYRKIQETRAFLSRIGKTVRSDLIIPDEYFKALL